MADLRWRSGYLRLTPQASLKRLERSYVYHRGRDELYEVDAEGLAFLAGCDGTRRGAELGGDRAFVEFCLGEQLLETRRRPAPLSVPLAASPTPSLRYLELQLLHDCNLRCRHCYLGPPQATALALADALNISREFAEMGGLKLMISGGEPLLYPKLREFIERCRELPLRLVLLTNGTLLDADNCPWLEVDDIQISLDGWRNGHDLLRGQGSFDRVMVGIQAARRAKRNLSLATMIHRGNLEEFERLRQFAEEIGVLSWGVDILCDTGNLSRNRSLMVPLEQAAPLLDYGFGGGYHGPSEGFACGHHLLTVLPDGRAVKCGFYPDAPLGDARESLRACWQRLPHLPLAELECRPCPVLADCGGGCRFRAGSPLAPDRAMCLYHGIKPPHL